MVLYLTEPESVLRIHRWITACLWIFLPALLLAETNVQDAEPKRPEFIDEVDLDTAKASQSIIFDSYEEVFIKNHEEQKITEIHFLGNVKIRFQDNTLMARRVVVTARGDRVLEIAAFENVEFHLGKDIYLAQEMMFEPDKQRGVLKNVRSYMGAGGGGAPFSSAQGWFYHAQKATILDKNRVVLDEVSFTTSDELLPHYSFYAGKLWFFKGQVVYALHLTYTVGQADFLYFPFFLRWEKGTGIRTAFGQEKRIGWYLMNSYTYRAPYGVYDLGMDIYERMGEYAFIKFNTTRPLSNITRLQAELEVADDVRLFSQGNRYTQLVDVLGNGQYTAIRQFSWRYKINMDFKASDLGINLFWEDNNDPNFSSKYNTRRMDTVDIQKLLQPNENSFYTRSDTSFLSTGQSLRRGFSLNAGKFTLNGNWTYERRVAVETNQYLNERYQYFIKGRSLPNLSYTPSSITLLKDFGSRIPKSYSVSISNTNLIFNSSKELLDFLSDFSSQSQVPVSALGSDTNHLLKKTTDNPGMGTNLTAGVSNQSPPPRKVVLPRITTNYNELYNFNSVLSARLNLSSSETLETNGIVISDKYIHSETGSMSFNGTLFNRLIGWNNTLSFVNQKHWTSLGTNFNDTYNSGAQLTLNSSASVNKTLNAWQTKPWELTVPIALSHSISYQLLKTLSVSRPREVSHSSSFKTGFSMFQKNLSFDINLGNTMRFRITNDVNDIYLNNKLEQRLTATTGVKAWWFTAGTSVHLDLLETRSNALELDYTGITNRFVGNAHPRLNLGLTLPENYLAASYIYDLIDSTNVNLRVNSKLALRNLAVPLLYELTSLNLDLNFYYDFLQKTSSIFTLNISMDIRLTKYWRLNFNTAVKNNQVYRYFVRNPAELPEGVSVLNFWEDLGDSLKIWDYEALKRGSFKIQGLHFNLSHDLDEWVLNLQFNVNRRIDTVRLFAYWEPSIRVEFQLNGSSDQFPPYEYKFVPDQYK